MLGRLFKRTDYKNLIQNGAIIIDVRSHREFNGGAIPGSENIPLDKLLAKVKDLKSKAVPVITVCASGMRSSVAKGHLKAAGLEVYNGGAWTKMIPFVY
ncbi:MAG: rhodanese-like domain-containing protein [Crocinitomicaceae bacterium]|nr:rhodanese-like domain-containing protein [Crocinitomicaceae bacterium]